MTDPVPIPRPGEPLTVGSSGMISRVWLRALQGVTGQALGGTVTKVTAGAGLSGGVIVDQGEIALVGPGGSELKLNGELLIGDATVGMAAVNTLTAGANVTITNGPGTITIAAVGGGDPLTLNGELLIGDSILGHGVVATLTAGRGVQVTNGPHSITIAELVPAVSTTISGSAPTGTASLAPVMMGLAGSITPVFSTRVMLTINGSCTNTVLGDGGTAQLSYGTGLAPANGAALAGTQIGSQQEWTVTAGGQLIPFSVTAIITGLTAGVPVWLDIALAAITGGVASISRVSLAVAEI